MTRTTEVLLSAGIAALLLAPAMSDASTLYCVAGGTTATCTPSSPTPLSSNFSVSGGTASAVAGLTSNPASLGAKAIATGTGASNGYATAKAAFSGFQVTFSGPSAGATTTSLNLSLSGSMSPGSSYMFADLTLVTVLSGSQGSVTGNGSLGLSVQPQPGPFPGPPMMMTSSSGILSGKTPIGGTFSTPALSIVSGDTVLLDMSIVVSAQCSNQGVGCTASADYLNTLKFVEGVPVFNLPSGWTANSADGSIVNNLLVAVPEPSTCALIAIPLLGLSASRRRRAS